MAEIQGKYNTAKVFTDHFDDSTKAQIENLLNQPCVSGSKIRIMPDCHAGAGCVIGTTMTIKDKVIPNLVGVDIGCGMLAVKLKEKRIDLPKFDSIVHSVVPAGFNIHSHPAVYGKAIHDKFLSDLRCYDKKNCKVTADNLILSLGTLGGGNHFIELDRDEADNIWLVIHSGSRHSGLCVAEYYQRMAYEENNQLGEIRKARLVEKRKEIIEKLTAEGRKKEIGDALKQLGASFPKEDIVVPYEVSYCSGDLYDDYIHDMEVMQRYAQMNRSAICELILRACHLHDEDLFETVHNYIDTRNMILRKGAVSATKGESLLIPINMRDGSLLCVGKGNDDWNQSAPHGAGRIMSRTEAFKSISVSDYRDAMAGIYSTCVGRETLDESPFVYKPIDEIIRNIEPTVEIVSRLRPIYNFKAGSENE